MHRLQGEAAAEGRRLLRVLFFWLGALSSDAGQSFRRGRHRFVPAGITHVSAVPNVDEYWTALQPHLQPFSADEQRVAIALYRELAKSGAVDDEQLGRALGISTAESHALLQRDSIKSLIYPDAFDRVIGFAGLASVPMHHRIEIDGHALSTWCAWDSLFIAEILGRPAQVASLDPESGEEVRLVVTPERIELVEPKETVISFIQPDAHVFATSATNVMAGFCHFIFFFASRSSGALDKSAPRHVSVYA
jgi:alkylmercury lyase